MTAATEAIARLEAEVAVADARGYTTDYVNLDREDARTILAELAAARAALREIAEGPVGTLDPAGDGGTFILTGHEWFAFRKIARDALNIVDRTPPAQAKVRVNATLRVKTDLTYLEYNDDEVTWI